MSNFKITPRLHIQGRKSGPSETEVARFSNWVSFSASMFKYRSVIKKKLYWIGIYVYIYIYIFLSNCTSIHCHFVHSDLLRRKTGRKKFYLTRSLIRSFTSKTVQPLNFGPGSFVLLFVSKVLRDGQNYKGGSVLQLTNTCCK